ncbi:MAG TPA: flagellar biosynthesis anti-sigma factor FlgM [Candidatus Sulfotelmatobacter sp.]|nr:flagellar biosynthesis anti-sigma factor FlgM [Candidatus Sulfotelmatobacter sp.]
MKIDPRIYSTGDAQNEPVSNAKKGSASGASSKAASISSSSSGDTLQISSRHAEVQQLTAQLANVPEVRTPKVAPLKAAVQQNTYQPDSGKIADAMLADQTSKSAKA